MTREEAIEELLCMKHIFIAESDADKALDMAIKALKEQKTGKWIIFPPCFEEICMCSNCKIKFKEAYQHRNICPYCGARMETNNEN